jgi:hypothetical protein
LGVYKDEYFSQLMLMKERLLSAIFSLFPLTQSPIADAAPAFSHPGISMHGLNTSSDIMNTPPTDWR